MLLSRLRAGLVAAAAACVVCATDAAAHGVSLDLHHPLPADSAVHRAFLVPWAQKVAQDSGNRISIHIHPASAGADPAKGLYEQAEDGDADLVWEPIRTSPERFPRLAVFQSVFLGGSAQDANRALAEYIRVNDLLDRDFGGVRVIAASVADDASSEATSLFVLAMSPASHRTLADDLKAVMQANSGAETAAWIGRVLDEARKATPAMTAAELEQRKNLAADRLRAIEQAGIGVGPLAESAREQLRAFEPSK
jgi:hypothetical protein